LRRAGKDVESPPLDRDVEPGAGRRRLQHAPQARAAAGAGGAAHLPGVIASMTLLPVIGVPIAIEPLGGVDSLYSIVQMPQGIPVATVAINGAYNAGLLAVQIMALQDEKLHNRLNSYRQKLAAKVEEKDCALREKYGQCKQQEPGDQ